MKKIFLTVTVLTLSGALLSSCKKQQNCKCVTNGVITDFYEKMNTDKAHDWCDTLEIQMNNGNNPQKDSTFCSLFRKK